MARIEPIKIEVEGLDNVAAAIKLLEQALGPRSYDGVQLLDKPRDDGVENTTILIGQRDKQQRDIVTASADDAREIGQSYVDRIIAEVQNVLDRQALGKSSTGRESVVVDRLALTDAIKRYMEIVSGRIDRQINAQGSPLKKLTDVYANYKKKKWGFVEPILRASGQLTSVLNPSGKPSIKFVKGARS